MTENVESKVGWERMKDEQSDDLVGVGKQK